MIDTAEKGYSEARLEKYRRIYPIIGAIGKPKNYDRFLINARAILGHAAYEEAKDFNQRVFEYLKGRTIQ
ncbi:MAG: hypothetical protein IJ048_14135 [Clostridia bacterium]|nr:hypothetical protein [Clostridia bacterium]